MISAVHFHTEAPDFAERAEGALAALAGCAGYLRGELGRSTEDTADWILLTEWVDIGSYRRALGSYPVKVRATPLMSESVGVPSSFETLVEVAADGSVALRDSDRQPLV
jgi:hypothetical protein